MCNGKGCLWHVCWGLLTPDFFSPNKFDLYLMCVLDNSLYITGFAWPEKVMENNFCFPGLK